MVMEADSPSHPAASPVPPIDVTAEPPPPSPLPVSLSPCEDVPGGRLARARRSKRARPATADDGAGPAASLQRKRRGAREPRAAGAAALAPTSPVKRNVRRARLLGREEEGKEAAEGKMRKRKTTGKVQEKGSGLALSSLSSLKFDSWSVCNGS
jgi:hypothetical protein